MDILVWIVVILAFGNGAIAFYYQYKDRYDKATYYLIWYAFLMIYGTLYK